jgi:hypothetical protein
MKAKGEFWRDGGLIYFVANGNVYAAKPTDVADSRSGYLQGRWESSVEQWNRYADALGRPKVSLSSLRDRIALAAVRRELAGMKMDYKTAMAIGQDAGNRNMKKHGRTAWNEEDAAVAAAAANKALDLIEE